jgi:hypothetical protein
MVASLTLYRVTPHVLGLRAGEREAIYEAVVELVKKRLEKARSLRRRAACLKHTAMNLVSLLSAIM